MRERFPAVALWVPAMLVLACEPVPPPGRPPIPDASFDANADVTVIFLETGPRADVPPDTARADAPGLDARVSTSGITLDGVMSELEWETATLTATTVRSFPPFAGCELMELRVLATESALFLGVLGNVGLACPNSALVVYIDLDPMVATGLFLNGTAGADVRSPLNAVISGPLNGLASGLFPDFAWGSMSTPLARSTGSMSAGWRDVRSIGRFTQPTTGHVTTCSTSGCETSITYGALGLMSGAHTIQVFARLGNGVDWATPTLPPESDAFFVSTSMPVLVVVP